MTRTCGCGSIAGSLTCGMRRKSKLWQVSSRTGSGRCRKWCRTFSIRCALSCEERRSGWPRSDGKRARSCCAFLHQMIKRIGGWGIWGRISVVGGGRTGAHSGRTRIGSSGCWRRWTNSRTGLCAKSRASQRGLVVLLYPAETELFVLRGHLDEVIQALAELRGTAGARPR